MTINGINVPQVQDAALQKFFHDIAEQLQLINNTSSVTGSPRSSIMTNSPVLDQPYGSPLQSPALSQGGTSTTSPNTPNPLTPATVDIPVLQNAQAQYTAESKYTRPAQPSRAHIDGASGVGRPGVLQDQQKRRSYLGDASNRDNVTANHRHSVQLPGEKNRKGGLTHQTSTTESRRKSKRELIAWTQ
jgi:hypothetical protein